MGGKVFKESQRFTQWWLWVLLFGTGAFLFYVQYNLGPIILMVISLVFLSIKLDTKIDETGISFRFFPFVSKHYPWREVTSARVVDYGFVGGWGVRLFTAYGTVYNIKGSKGLAIETKGGEKVCIGTQLPHELQSTINKYHSKKEF